MDHIMSLLTLLIAVLSGVATAIPLIIRLVKTVQDLVKERNWSKLVDETLKLMERAKEKFEDNQGSMKKAWVLEEIQHYADSVHYEVDLDAVGELIDAICDTSKVLRNKSEKSEEQA